MMLHDTRCWFFKNDLTSICFRSFLITLAGEDILEERKSTIIRNKHKINRKFTRFQKAKLIFFQMKMPKETFFESKVSTIRVLLVLRFQVCSYAMELVLRFSRYNCILKSSINSIIYKITCLLGQRFKTKKQNILSICTLTVLFNFRKRLD